MKPRVILEQSTLPDGSELILHEHDGRHYLTVDGIQTASPATRVSEFEMAALACSPFRPVRQPKVWVAGLGTGAVLRGIRSTLLQKRATLMVAEPSRELPGWLRKHLEDTEFLDDQGLVITQEPGAEGLIPLKDTLHAILVHADTAPVLNRTKPLHEDRRWLTAAHDALLSGGLLAIASSSPIPGIEKTLERVGLTPICHEIDAVPNARRPRKHFLWLGQKGKYES